MIELNNYTKEKLLEAFSGKDDVFMYAMYSQHYQEVRILVANNSGNEEDVEDVFQEAMVVLYRKLLLPEFELTSSLSAFIYTVAKNIWYKELALRKKKPTDEISIGQNLYDERDIIETIQQHARLKLYREKFNSLSADCKRVLQMFINKIPIREITQAMGYKSDQHTKNRRLRCKASLIKNIRNSEQYKELGYGNIEKDNDIPRW